MASQENVKTGLWHQLRCYQPSTWPRDGQKVVLGIYGATGCGHCMEWAYETVIWSPGYWQESGAVASKWADYGQSIAFAHGQMGEVRIDE